MVVCELWNLASICLAISNAHIISYHVAKIYIILHLPPFLFFHYLTWGLTENLHNPPPPPPPFIFITIWHEVWPNFLSSLLLSLWHWVPLKIRIKLDPLQREEQKRRRKKNLIPTSPHEQLILTFYIVIYDRSNWNST
jgi:hypothetical protein